MDTLKVFADQEKKFYGAMRLKMAVTDAEGAAASLGVLTQDAATVHELVTVATEAIRLSLILGSAASAALRKAETL